MYIHHTTTEFQISVICSEAITATHTIPAGCTMTTGPLWCNEAEIKYDTTNSTNDEVRKWELGGQNRNRNSKKKSQTKINALKNVQKKLERAQLYSQCIPCVLDLQKVQQCCCFNELPFSVDPASMMSFSKNVDHQDTDNASNKKIKIEKKRNQVQSMLQIILPLIQDGETAVEFAAGSGYIGLVLAALRPKVHVILMDQNPVSIQFTKNRAAKANLKNVDCVVCDIRNFHVECGYSLGIALHACGSASDYVLDHCIQNQANYVIAPCCAGFMQNTLENNMQQVPTSISVRNAGVTREEYISLTACADHSNSSTGEKAAHGKRAMAMLDLDRNLRAEESAVEYETKYYRMVPEGCTPKNQILVGKIEDEIKVDNNDYVVVKKVNEVDHVLLKDRKKSRCDVQ